MQKCIFQKCIFWKCIFQKSIYPKCIFAKYTRLACLLSFASLLFDYWVRIILTKTSFNWQYSPKGPEVCQVFILRSSCPVMFVQIKTTTTCPHDLLVLSWHLEPLPICQHIPTIASVTIYLSMSRSQRRNIVASSDHIGNHQLHIIHIFRPQKRPKCMIVTQSDHTSANPPADIPCCGIAVLVCNQKNWANSWLQQGDAHIIHTCPSC